VSAVLHSAIVDILILGGFFALGSLILSAVRGVGDPIFRAGLAVPVGGGVLTWCLFLLSWARVPLTAAAILTSYAVLTLLFSVLAWRSGNAETVMPLGKDSRDEPLLARLIASLCEGIAIVLVAVAFVLSVGLSYYSWDAIAQWAVGGYGIALEGSILGLLEWGHAGLYYPPNVQLLISVFRTLEGDILPGSKAMFPLFYAGLLMVCYRFWRARGLRRVIASAATLLLAGVPILFLHGTMGYTNLLMTLYLVSGVICGIDGVENGAVGSTSAAGILLGLAGWSRPEGYILALVCLAALGSAALSSRRSLRTLIPAVIPVVIGFTVWLAFSLLVTRSHPQPYVEPVTDLKLAIQGLTIGDVRWRAFLTIARYFAGQVLRFRDWGLYIAIVGVLLVVNVRSLIARGDVARTTLIVASFGLGLAAVGGDYICAYSPHGPDYLYTCLSMDFNRVFMPAGICLGLLAFIGFAPRQVRVKALAPSTMVSAVRNEARGGPARGAPAR